MKTIRDLIATFAGQLTETIEAEAVERARASLLEALGVPVRRDPGRPPKAFSLAARKIRKNPPRQLCPSPGCRNPAAPIFGMLCAKHKDAPKRLVKKWREARRAKKLKAAA
jgi:hypothetical protein